MRLPPYGGAWVRGLGPLEIGIKSYFGGVGWGVLTVLPYMGDEGVLRGLQVLHDVLVQRVHVLHQPLGRGVVHLGWGQGEVSLWMYARYLSGVVKHREVAGLLEVRLDELGVRVVAVDHLLHEGLVGGLGEPALLVHQRQDAHGLGGKYGPVREISTRYQPQYIVNLLTSAQGTQVTFSKFR